MEIDCSAAVEKTRVQPGKNQLKLLLQRLGVCGHCSIDEVFCSTAAVLKGTQSLESRKMEQLREKLKDCRAGACPAGPLNVELSDGA